MLEVAGIDENEFKVSTIVDHRLEDNNKKNKTHYYYYYLVKFDDDGEEWFPYMEMRELEGVENYLRDYMNLVRQLKLNI